MYGNSNDPVKGRQMPDHYSGRPYNFGSVSSPIGTQMTQAVGFGWAAKMRGENLATLVYFGEGATSSSEFHNAMNFAGVYKTPTVFLCRNNGWAISVPVEMQTGSQTFAQKGFAYGVRAVRVDGNDLLAVYKATRDALALCRAGTPVLLECLTYRLSGHSTSDDPTRYRGQDEMAAERAKDPLPRFRAHLEKRGLWSEDQQTALVAAYDAEIKAAVERAEKAAPPALDTLFDDVFAERPWHLREQYAECLAAPRPAGHGGH
jgi:2-oxoisovalerate dehydrogenase E1 component alpha subunit